MKKERENKGEIMQGREQERKGIWEREREKDR